jgi:hypothetical protein
MVMMPVLAVGTGAVRGPGLFGRTAELVAIVSGCFDIIGEITGPGWSESADHSGCRKLHLTVFCHTSGRTKAPLAFLQISLPLED